MYWSEDLRKITLSPTNRINGRPNGKPNRRQNYRQKTNGELKRRPN
jgi:hypothetical protein